MWLYTKSKLSGASGEPVEVIVFTVVITAIYVKRANREFDDLTAEIAQAVLK